MADAIERLTKRVYTIAEPSFEYVTAKTGVNVNQIIERLEQYENTGLTPEEIEQLKGECSGWKADAKEHKEDHADV